MESKEEKSQDPQVDVPDAYDDAPFAPDERADEVADVREPDGTPSPTPDEEDE